MNKAEVRSQIPEKVDLWVCMECGLTALDEFAQKNGLRHNDLRNPEHVVLDCDGDVVRVRYRYYGIVYEDGDAHI